MVSYQFLLVHGTAGERRGLGPIDLRGSTYLGTVRRTPVGNARRPLADALANLGARSLIAAVYRIP